MVGRGGILCPVYCGGSDTSGDNTPPRTVYIPAPQQSQLCYYPTPPPEYGRYDRAVPQYLPSSSSATPSVTASQPLQIIPATALNNHSLPREQQRLQPPSLPLQCHSRRLRPFENAVSSNCVVDLKDREDVVLAALLSKERELQARIEHKQRQLRDMRRQLHDKSVENGRSRFRVRSETSREIEQLRTELCDKETELEQLRAELDLMRKETTSMAEGTGPSKQTRPPFGTKEEKKLAIGESLREREEENRLLSRRLEALRDERRDLREILVQKERQLATALATVDPTCKESSALQLGMQAITMVQDSVGLKKRIQTLQAELTAARENYARGELLLEDTLRKLNEKRKEAAGLLELVSQRDMKIARVETFLQHRTRELEQLQEKARLAREQEALRLEKAAEELRIMEDQQSALKSIIASRDEKVLCLQNELVRRDAIIRQLEERSRALAHDLELGGNHVQQLIRSSAAKDAYMYELEAQLRQNEVQRQASYLAEVSRTRQFAFETRLKEEECRVALGEKNEELAAAQHDLSRRCTTLQQIRQAVSSIESADTCYRPSALTQSTLPKRKKERAACVPPRSQTTVNVPGASALSVSPTAFPISLPQYPLQDSLKALQADSLLERSSSPTSSPLANNGSPTGVAVHAAPVSVPTADGAAGTGGQRSPTHQAYSDAVAVLPPVFQAYNALPGDSVDEVVGATLLDPRYTPYTPVIRRLSPGKYSIGSTEFQLHLHPAHGLLAQTSDRSREWVPFPTFLDDISSQGLLFPTLASSFKAEASQAAGIALQVATTKAKGAWHAKAPLRPATLKSKTASAKP